MLDDGRADEAGATGDEDGWHSYEE
jgi:hypothetical protein